jgi:hypothetical protein
MSHVGRTLASRAELDTRWKLSKEFAATVTFFLASGFMFVDAMFTVILSGMDITLAGVVGDAVKLMIFPFMAFIMELNFLRKSRKVLKPAPVPEDIPVIRDEPAVEPEEEPMMESEEPEVGPEEAMLEEEPSYTEEVEEETSTEEDYESYEEETDEDSEDEW